MKSMEDIETVITRHRFILQATPETIAVRCSFDQLTLGVHQCSISISLRVHFSMRHKHATP